VASTAGTLGKACHPAGRDAKRDSRASRNGPRARFTAPRIPVPTIAPAWAQTSAG